jgi:hypothetical protein
MAANFQAMPPLLLLSLVTLARQVLLLQAASLLLAVPRVPLRQGTMLCCALKVAPGSSLGLRMRSLKAVRAGQQAAAITAVSTAFRATAAAVATQVPAATACAVVRQSSRLLFCA